MSEQISGGEMPDDAITGLLAGALQSPGLSDAALARVRTQVEADWRSHTQQRARPSSRTGYRGWAGLIAASLSACAVLSWWTLTRSTPVLGVADSGTAEVTAIRVNQPLDAASNMRVRLSAGGVLRIKAGAALAFTAADEIELRRGAVYIDFDKGSAHGALRVRTPFGVVQHLGTQFEVALLPTQLRVRVREGAVLLQGAASTRVQAGEEVTVDAANLLQRRAIAPYDGEWAWVETPPGGFDVEGRSVLQLLGWVARESGRRLEFTDDRANQLAARTVLHGSILGMSPDLALRAMLSTTSLVADARADVIAVGSAP